MPQAGLERCPAVRRAACWGFEGDRVCRGPGTTAYFTDGRVEGWDGLRVWEGLSSSCPLASQFSTDPSLHAPQALRSLKAKQRTEKRIEALHAKLDTVQGILDRIYASQTDQMVATPPYSSTQLVSPWVLVTCSFGFAVWRIPGFFRDVAGVAFVFPVRRFGLSGYRVN